MKKFLTALIGRTLSSYLHGRVKTAKNELDSSLTQITNKQAKLIFTKVKSYPNNTELSIAIIENGKTKFVGVKRVNNSIVPIENKEKIFEIGSISKVFTATLLTNFIQEGKLQLDDPIQDYHEFKIRTNDTITFKELANHTSGLPALPSDLNLSTVDPNNPYKNYNSQKLKEYLAEKLELKEKIGAKYEYSNIGAGTLGFSLTEIAKSSYENLLQEKIFLKYKMFNSTTIREKVHKTLIKGLDFEGNETSNWDFDVLVGAGGILSSVNDLSKFASAQFKEENLELMLTQKMSFTINRNMSVGLGWHIIKGKKKEELIWHNGGTGGYSSSMVLDKENKNGIIVLSNVSAYNKQMGNIDKICFALIGTLKRNYEPPTKAKFHGR